MAEAAFEDNDPSVYSPYVLYVKKNDANCDAVTHRMDAMPICEHVYVQDVMKLANRPYWLRGVPTLFHHSTENVITGMRDILMHASSWRSSEPSSMPSSIYSSGISSSSTLSGSNLTDSDMFSIEGDPTSVPVRRIDTNNTFQNSNNQMGERAKRKAEMAAETNNAVELMQNARAAMDRRMHASMQHGSRLPPRNMMTDERETAVPQRRVW